MRGEREEGGRGKMRRGEKGICGGGEGGLHS